MADVPLPGPSLNGFATEAVPADVRELMARLGAAGHAAYVVGGSLRDLVIGRIPADWDLATDAHPERILEILPGAVYENAFGTVVVRHGRDAREITTFRSDHEYRDFRRPHRVEFGATVEVDLARRDFTVNAMAWGGPPGAEPGLVDPHGGRGDAAAHLLRAVGDPDRRFAEDALRMIRAIRLAATLDFAVEPATLEAIARHAELVRHLSGERIAAEVLRLLEAPRPSVGLQLAMATGLLRWLAPDLAEQAGVPQNKIPGEDLWAHTLRSVDAAPADRPVVRLAALLHDVGKPATAADGRFHGHEHVGAEMAEAWLRRLRMPRATVDRVRHLVRHHMWVYEPGWSDTAVRRFIGKVGRRELDELFALRAADNVGSGLEPDAAGLAELRRRVEEQLAAEVALDVSDLAVGGDDLIADLGLAEGPAIGRILERLLDRVIADPSLNDRPTLLAVARSMLADDG